MANDQNPLAIYPAGRFRDNLGRMKVTQTQNIYDADFEYSLQPLRWEVVTAGGGSVTHVAGQGGAQMSVGTASGDLVVRQSRPYHRYQPGKTMFMATNINLGGTQANQFQRAGFFDDGNGIFFEQAGVATTANPYGMFVVVRSDSGNPALPTDTRIPLNLWNGDNVSGTAIIPTIDWTRVEMVWMEYAWYGAGLLRWGVYINGDPIVLHQIGTGNGVYSANGLPLPAVISAVGSGNTGTLTTTTAHALLVGSTATVVLSGYTATGWNGTWTATAASSTTLTINFSGGAPTTATVIGQTLVSNQSQQIPWSRTGNLPVRYELRNTGTTLTNTTMFHYGVSVIVEGRIDGQRGFTYSYGMAPQLPRRNVAANTVRYPVLSIQPNLMGKIEYSNTNAAATAGGVTTLTASSATWTVSQWQGRMLYYQAVIGGGISTGTVATQTGTITFTGNHNLNTGDTIIISGATPSGWNGAYTFTKTTATAGTIVFGGTAPAAYTSGATVVSPYTARITSNTATVLTFQDVVTGGALANTPSASQVYQIGLIDRGQLLPQTLLLSSDALCVVELIASTPGNAVSLQGASFATLSTLGSPNSFASRDVSATGLAGGEVVYAFTAPAGGSGLLQLDLSNFFPILNTIRGNQPDILTVAVTTQAGTAANVGAHMVCQEAMS